MTTFALQEIPEIKGRIVFYELIVDGENLFQEFLHEISDQGNYDSEIRTIQVRMQEMAEMRFPMPKTKCRDITPKNDRVKEYELKTRNLRVYLFHEESTGRVIVTAGKKTSQSKDIRKFRKIKKDYINSK